MNAFSYWRTLQLASTERGSRLAPAAERERWRALAHDYDRNALHRDAPEVAVRLAALVQPGESVLEIGPGTGGFTVPVARRAVWVTAVDLSDAMLDALRHRLTGERLANVAMLTGEWPNVATEPHDVVLAVNSLYRVTEIDLCIARMMAAARREVIVCWSVGHNPPVLPSLVDPAGPRRYRPGVTYIHLLLALHELGIDASLDIWPVRRRVWRASYDQAAARLLAVADPTDDERRAAAALARAWFAPTNDGVAHEYDGAVAVIRWRGGG